MACCTAEQTFIESCVACVGSGQVSRVEMGSTAHMADHGYPAREHLTS